MDENVISHLGKNKKKHLLMQKIAELQVWLDRVKLTGGSVAFVLLPEVRKSGIAMASLLEYCTGLRGTRLTGNSSS